MLRHIPYSLAVFRVWFSIHRLWILIICKHSYEKVIYISCYSNSLLTTNSFISKYSQTCTLYTCTLYTCTLYTCTLYTCTMYSVHCTHVHMYSVHCTLYTCTLYTCTHVHVYTVHCTLYTVHCTLYTVHMYNVHMYTCVHHYI